MTNLNDDSQELLTRPQHVRCPVCGHPLFKKKYSINHYTLVQCCACQVIFVREKLSQQDLDQYYFKEVDGAEGKKDCVYLDEENIENLSYYYRRLKALILKRIQTGKILDIGCNAGYFLDVMEGFECYGVERSPDYAKVAKSKYGERVFEGTFEDYQVPDGFFDCISMQDVFDHMLDPMAVLEKCRRLLKPDGILVVKVHDLSCLYARMTGKNFYALIPPAHLFFYNRPSLKTALQKASFEIIFSKHIGHLMFLSTIVYRLSRKDPQSIFFHLHRWIEKTWLGRQKIHKNLHDIITIIAVKKSQG